MTRRGVLALAALIVATAGWYWFRPERAFIDRRVNEAAPETAATVLLRGEFRSEAHETRGKAAIERLSSGRAVLRLTEFATSNGPDVRVYLVRADDVRGKDDLAAGFIDLGALKGNIGDQNYELPAGLDLAAYHAVTVWCRRFGVNFGAAPLRS